MDDDYCDPLELYPHSHLGVPGLLQAVRDGTVAVANALGSGVLQGPGFLPFLPGLCRHFLGEELKLPSVRTWWCGVTDSLRYVIQNLSRLVIKPALPTVGTDPVFGAELTKADLEELRAKIEARPRDFVAQEAVSSFMAPVFLSGDEPAGAESRRFVVRAYLAASDDTYAVMPGGLTRVTDSPESQVVSLQKGGGSKDTWILAEGPVSKATLLPAASAPVALSRGGGDLSSRVADDLFWLGRYVQRAEAAARLARCAFNRLSDLNAAESPRAMAVLLRDLAGRPAPRPGPASARALAAEMFSPRDPSGLRSSASHVHALARVLRDRISSDAWRILQSIHRDIKEFDGRIDDDQAGVVLELLNKLLTGFLAFGGMAAESMTRGQSWRFLDMGLRLERGVTAAKLVRSMLVEELTDTVPTPVPPAGEKTPPGDKAPAGAGDGEKSTKAADPPGQSFEEAFLLDAVLEVADSSLTYRRRYLTQLEVPAVVDLLVADETNPRAVAYQIRLLEDHLSCLPRDSSHPQRSPDHQLALKLRTNLRLADLAVACRPIQGRRKGIESLMTESIHLLASISERVGQMFFSHATVSPYLLSPEPDREL